MSGRILSDAFEVYVGMGPSRSYQAVANHYGVTKRAVTRHASKHGWAGRLAAIEKKAQKKTDAQLVDAVAEMNERHLKVLKVIQGKALEALRSMPIARAMDAVRALDLSIRSERVIHGEPTDRTATSVEEVIRQQYQRWMVTGHEDEEAPPTDG